jgi:ABC-type nitrate/sulfonate/bicarbonate transport system ATPase subunit
VVQPGEIRDMTAEIRSHTALIVDGVSKTFRARHGDTPALLDVSFTVADGEFYSIVGPSGCGKSTLLNVIAGLEDEDNGHIGVGEGPVPSRTGPVTAGGHRVRSYQDQSNWSASRLGTVAYMPQKDLLLPWRTVLDNAALGLELTGTSGRTARERAAELLDRFGLDGFADAYPSQLSGGMRQRTAFLRTVLTGKPLMLLDEPFGALDALTRRSMQEWLLNVWTDMRQTVVLITHDVDEAIFLSDHVAVMSPRPGRIVAEHHIGLPRPRRAEMVTDPGFVEVKRAIMADLRYAAGNDTNASE